MLLSLYGKESFYLLWVMNESTSLTTPNAFLLYLHIDHTKMALKSGAQEATASCGHTTKLTMFDLLDFFQRALITAIDKRSTQA